MRIRSGVRVVEARESLQVLRRTRFLSFTSNHVLDKRAPIDSRVNLFDCHRGWRQYCSIEERPPLFRRHTDSIASPHSRRRTCIWHNERWPLSRGVRYRAKAKSVRRYGVRRPPPPLSSAVGNDSVRAGRRTERNGKNTTTTLDIESERNGERRTAAARATTQTRAGRGEQRQGGISSGERRGRRGVT